MSPAKGVGTEAGKLAAEGSPTTPPSHACKVAPSEKRSVLTERTPTAASGARNPRVPRASPSASRGGPDKPRSISTASGSPVRRSRTFAGLTSPWTSPAAWSAARAATVSRATRNVSRVRASPSGSSAAKARSLRVPSTCSSTSTASPRTSRKGTPVGDSTRSSSYTRASDRCVTRESTSSSSSRVPRASAGTTLSSRTYS